MTYKEESLEALEVLAGFLSRVSGIDPEDFDYLGACEKRVLGRASLSEECCIVSLGFCDRYEQWYLHLEENGVIETMLLDAAYSLSDVDDELLGEAINRALRTNYVVYPL